MDLPAFLVLLMDAKAIPGKELARRLDVRASYVSQVRLGKCPIAPPAIGKWIKALELVGDEAEEFRALALIQQGPPELRAYVHSLRKQLAKVRRRSNSNVPRTDDDCSP